jgi:hypothetical protein
MAQPMGLGAIGSRPALAFKRKFRWTFEVLKTCPKTGQNFNVPAEFVKLAARPNISIEETEINYLHGKTWIPGKGTWETITVTYYDVATADNANLWTWLSMVYQFNDPVNLKMGSARADYSGTGVLNMYDGCGTIVETWKLGHLWPTAINFGDLDYSNSEECTIELTLRYSQVEYLPGACAAFPQPDCCTPCGL